MVLDTVSGAARSYYTSEMERWEETKELGAVGTFKRDIQFGATGPAPSFDSDLDLDHGPEPFGTINSAAKEVWDETAGTPDDSTPLWLFVALFVGGVMLLSYTLGQLFEVHVGN